MNPVPVPKSFRHLLSRSQVCTVPNLLTLLRLLLIPFLFYACRIRADILLSVFLLLLTGLLDVLDGLIARKWNQISDLGKILDPVADKLTQLVLMISLIRRRRIILPLLILFCAKEAVQGFLRWLVLRNCGEVHSSEWFGKASTATLFLVMGTLILFPGLPDLPASLMLLACGTMLIVSLAGYAAHDLKLLRSRREDPSGSRSGL